MFEKAKALRYHAALFSLVHSRWIDIEKAKQVAAEIAFLAEIELDAIAPEFNKKNSPEQRAIAAAIYVCISKTGIATIGIDNITRLRECTTDFAQRTGQIEFYNNMVDAMHHH